MKAALNPLRAGVAVLTLTAVTASAQSLAPRAERPSRALFGSGVGDTSQLLTASGTLGAGWDTSLAADARGGSQPRLSDLTRSGSGMFGTGQASLGYSLSLERVSLGASAGSMTRYYPSVSDKVYRQDYASARGSVPLPFRLLAGASMEYRPFSLAAIYPALVAEDATVLADDIANSSEHYVSWQASLGTSRDLQLTPRLRLSGEADLGARKTRGGSDHFRSYGGGGKLTYGLGKGLDLKAGYHIARADYAAYDRDVTRQVIDAGVDYSRSLSFSRRTTLSFGSGTAAVTRPDVPGGTRFRATGNVNLTHEIGRTWAASAQYARRVQFVENWPEPVLSDAVGGSFGGLITRRLGVSSSVAASTGRVGITSAAGEFDTYHAGAVLSYAVTRNVAAGLTYSTYYHRFDDRVRLAPGFGPGIERHRVAAQVSFWAPLFQQSRRANATR